MTQALRRFASVWAESKWDQHLMRDLRIAGLVSADQAEAIATENGGQAVDQKENGKGEEDCNFADSGPARQPLRPLFGEIRSGRFQGCFHFQQFSNRSQSPAALSKTTISARLRAVLASLRTAGVPIWPEHRSRPVERRQGC